MNPRDQAAAIDRLMAAVQEYHRATEGEDGVVITEYLVVYAGVSMRTASDQTYIGTTGHGPVHSSIGLAEILNMRVLEQLEGDE